jgi:hypothetical protein
MTHPTWIDPYARSLHQAFMGMVPAHWSSLDGFGVFAAYQGVFLQRIHELKMACDAKDLSRGEVWMLIQNPSTLRCAILFLAYEYQMLEDKGPLRTKARDVFDWLVAILETGVQEDTWALHSNLVQLPEHERILSDTPWVRDTETVRAAARLYTATTAHVFALYRDYFPQDAHDIIGPYDAASVFGSDSSLLIKRMWKLRPLDVWREVEGFPWNEIEIRHVLKGVHARFELIGMHSLYDGPVIPNTAGIAVKVGDTFLGKSEIIALANEVAEYATEYSRLYGALDIAGRKKKFIEWECYQFVNVFKAVDLDWRPTEEMLAPVLAANIGMGAHMDSFPGYEEYATSPDHEVYWLKELYQE